MKLLNSLTEDTHEGNMNTDSGTRKKTVTVTINNFKLEQKMYVRYTC